MIPLNSKPSLPDQADRDIARKKLDRNVVVTAGAGTGKTSLLTDRALFTLLGRGVPVQALVALTFTEKAAGEIRVRLSERLSALLTAEKSEWSEKFLAELHADFGVSPQKAAELAATALENMDQAPIGTLHSFAAQILRAYPLEAGVDPGFQVDQGDLWEELFESEWAAWLDRELGERAPREKDWLEILRLAPLEQIEALARALCQPRADPARLQLVPAAMKDWLKESAHILETESGRQPPAKGKIAEQLTELVSRLRKLSTTHQQAGSSPLLQSTSANGARGQPLPEKLPSLKFVNASWPSGWDDVNEERWEAATKLCAKCSPETEALVQHAVALLAPFAEIFKRSYAWRGFLSFEGLLLSARALVRDHRQAREELKRKYKAFLVDEFQDTDPLQGELLIYLAEKSGHGAQKWKDVLLEPGKLFVVGDPKQSIYRFRGADIAAYEGFLKHILEQKEPGLSCELKANFRSQPGVIACVNAAFAKLMQPVAGSQPAYIPISSVAAGSGGGVESVIVQGGDAPVAKTRRAEAEWIAQWIESNRRAYEFKDIALLFRSTTPLAEYLELFKARGIPYVVEGEKYFYGTQEVRDFLNLLRALDDPGDKIALAGVLRSPIVALSDEELRRASLGDGFNYQKRSADPRIEAVFAALREIRALVGRKPLTEILEAVYDKTRLLELASAAYHDQQTLANLLKLGRLAAAAAEAQGETLKGFIHRVTRFINEAREEGESPLADEHLDAVRVMTIHKSKGLEYPVVILPNLSGAISGGRDPEELRVDEEAGALGLRMGAGPANAAMLYLEEKEKRRERDERIRLLYVAFTRAKERLILLGSDSPKGQSLAGILEEAELWPRLGPGSSFLELPLGQSIGRGAVPRAKAPVFQLPIEAAVAAWKRRTAEREELGAQPRFLTPTSGKKHVHFQRDAEAPEVRGDLVGRLCHKALERWDFASSLAKELAAAAGSLAAEATEAELAAAKDEAAGILGGFEHSPLARRLAKAEPLGRELPFVFGEGAQARRGTIDFLCLEGGRLLVVDYKTDAVKSADMLKKAKGYEPQMRMYAEAVGRALSAKVEHCVVFLRLARAIPAL